MHSLTFKFEEKIIIRVAGFRALQHDLFIFQCWGLLFWATLYTSANIFQQAAVMQLCAISICRPTCMQCTRYTCN